MISYFYELSSFHTVFEFWRCFFDAVYALFDVGEFDL